MIMGADFETEAIDKNEDRVTLAGYSILYSSKEIVRYYDNIDDFLDDLIYKTKRESVTCYFHNLSFDGQFIIYRLLERKIEFDSLITDDKKIITISIKLNRYKLKFVDSYKLLPFKLKKIAEDFDLKIKKGNYVESNKKGGNDFIEYFKKDVLILRFALEKLNINQKTKLTIGSIALTEFKKLCGNDYRKLYPKLSKETDTVIREAYAGGICYANKKYVEKGYVYDLNSSYPYVCACDDYPLPKGKPYFLNDLTKLKNEKLFIIKIWFDYIELKNYIPCIKDSFGSFYGCSWIKERQEDVAVSLTNYDYELLRICYNYKIKKIEYAIGFECDYEKKYLKNYMKKYYELKSKTKGAEKVFNKLMLNSLTGKFGSKVERYKCIPFISKVDDLIEFKEEKVDVEYEYIPLIVFITSIARFRLMEGVINNFDNFCYCDTDSIHLTEKAKFIKIDNKELGAWKLESEFDFAKFIRQKCYIEWANNIPKITISGLTEEGKKEIEKMKVKEQLLNVDIGFTIPNCKLRTLKVVGGVRLVPTDFTIKEKF